MFSSPTVARPGQHVIRELHRVAAPRAASPNGSRGDAHSGRRDSSRESRRLLELDSQRADLVLDATSLRAVGQARFRQTDFGITPPSAGGGKVRAADELVLTFDVTAR